MSGDKYTYGCGAGSYVSTEALPGTLPLGRNSPQVCPYGLYAEQLSGTAFTVPRGKNMKAWLYRIRPSVAQSKFIANADQSVFEDFSNLVIDPNHLRWDPAPLLTSEARVDFSQGLKVACGGGDPANKEGICIYNYACNTSMTRKSMYNSDGDFLIVPQTGSLDITTEMGKLFVQPREIVVIPRGIKFSVAVTEACRGYICEVFKGHFEIPGLGPIGANGLANPRDFKVPLAWYEDVEGDHILVTKYIGKMFTATMDHSPFDVVGWHGNYCPFKYDLRLFNTMNTVTYDHPDPSIYTVLTCPSDEPGVAIVDFVIFPPRWMVGEDTFRPPYYHRNYMAEFMGMIYGKYDAKGEGFSAGGSSLHSVMTSHGPDAETFIKASTVKLEPAYFDEGLAFMFESTFMMKVSQRMLDSPQLQQEYIECWQPLPKIFNGDIKPTFPTHK